MMKKVIVNCLAILALVGLQTQCTTENDASSENKMYKDIYVDEFKLIYFRLLLRKSYNNSEAVQEIIALDHSGFTEPVLSMGDMKLIDSLTTLDNSILKADSANRIGRVAEGSEGKHQLGYVLETLSGGWLDSLANKRYKELEVSLP